MSELRVALICRPEVAPAFALAGFRPLVVAEAEEAARRLTALLSDPRVGLVLVEGPLHDGLDADLQRRLSARPVPLVVPVPAPSWTEHATADQVIVELLRRAIGYQVRLR
ncbi:MAG TPA: V-type ATP synthase subunit F [Myxococcaceae bacterium]|nr:V-type ATP synthase subunit F [Myxococcaceae bacterium]